MRAARIALLALATSCAAAGLVACGDDEVGTTRYPVGDGSAPPPPTTPPTTTPDAASDAPPVTPPDATPDGGPADFSDYVKSLIQNQTNATAIPADPTTGTYTDRESQADYPAAFFQ